MKYFSHIIKYISDCYLIWTAWNLYNDNAFILSSITFGFVLLVRIWIIYLDSVKWNQLLKLDEIIKTKSKRIDMQILEWINTLKEFHSINIIEIGPDTARLFNEIDKHPEHWDNIRDELNELKK